MGGADQLGGRDPRLLSDSRWLCRRWLDASGGRGRRFAEQPGLQPSLCSICWARSTSMMPLFLMKQHADTRRGQR